MNTTTTIPLQNQFIKTNYHRGSQNFGVDETEAYKSKANLSNYYPFSMMVGKSRTLPVLSNSLDCL